MTKRDRNFLSILSCLMPDVFLLIIFFVVICWKLGAWWCFSHMFTCSRLSFHFNIQLSEQTNSNTYELKRQTLNSWICGLGSEWWIWYKLNHECMNRCDHKHMYLWVCLTKCAYFYFYLYFFLSSVPVCYYGLLTMPVFELLVQ